MALVLNGSITQVASSGYPAASRTHTPTEPGFALRENLDIGFYTEERWPAREGHSALHSQRDQPMNQRASSFAIIHPTWTPCWHWEQTIEVSRVARRLAQRPSTPTVRRAPRLKLRWQLNFVPEALCPNKPRPSDGVAAPAATKVVAVSGTAS